MTDHRFFKRQGPFTLEMLAAKAEAALLDPSTAQQSIDDVATLLSADKRNITFLSNRKYMEQLKESKAGACILSKEDCAIAPSGMALLVSPDPYYSYACIASLFYPNTHPSSGIHPTAVISPTAVIGKNVTIDPYVVIGDRAEIGEGSFIGAHTVIGHGVVIGKHCYISNQVSVSHAMIGNEVTLHNGVRIGQDGFGFATHRGQHLRIPQLGRVIIHDRANIGANTTIDRGAGPDTVIGEQCQIDNLVQIGHNVRLGKGCVIVAQVGIAGSTELGDYVVLGGQVGVAGHLKIGTGAKIAAQSGLTKDVAAGATQGGTPAVPLRQYHKQALLMKKMLNKTGE